MGTLMGHVLPGTFFITFSLWWLVRALHNYYSNPKRYMSGITMASCCRRQCFARIPLDMWIVIILATFGGIMEIVTSFINEGVFVMGNRQHLTMYSAFALAGFISILSHHNIKFVPKGAEYMAFLLALFVEMVLFAFHLHGRDEVDKHIHMLLVYTIAGCILTTALELQYPRSINISIARHFLVLVQGTWFYQIAFSLYPPEGMPKLDLKELENIMLVTLFYAWHLISCTIGVTCIAALVYCCTTPDSNRYGRYGRGDEMKLLPSNGKSQHTDQYTDMVNNASDEENDLFSAPNHRSLHSTS